MAFAPKRQFPWQAPSGKLDPTLAGVRTSVEEIIKTDEISPEGVLLAQNDGTDPMGLEPNKAEACSEQRTPAESTSQRYARAYHGSVYERDEPLTALHRLSAKHIRRNRRRGQTPNKVLPTIVMPLASLNAWGMMATVPTRATAAGSVTPSEYNIILHGLADTGASRTCISEQALKKFPKAERHLREATCRASVIDNKPIRILGEKTIHFRLCNKDVQVNALVMPAATAELILGLDIMRREGLLIDTGRMTLRHPITGESQALQESRPPIPSYGVTLAQDLTIKPGWCGVAALAVDTDNANLVGLLEPGERLVRRYQCGFQPQMVQTDSEWSVGTLRTHIANPTTRCITIPKGETVAELSAVDIDLVRAIGLSCIRTEETGPRGSRDEARLQSISSQLALCSATATDQEVNVEQVVDQCIAAATAITPVALQDDPAKSALVNYDGESSESDTGIGDLPTEDKPLHDLSNGQAEKGVASFKQMLKTLVDVRAGDWHLYIPELQVLYNGSINATTGVAPCTLATGSNPRSPARIAMQRWAGVLPKAMESTREDFVTRMQSIRYQVYRKLVKAVNKTMDRLAPAQKRVEFKVGQRVKRRLHFATTSDLYSTALPKSLDARWAGPYEVLQVLKPAGVSYVIKRLRDGLRIVEHHSKLAPYFSANDPATRTFAEEPVELPSVDQLTLKPSPLESAKYGLDPVADPESSADEENSDRIPSSLPYELRPKEPVTTTLTNNVQDPAEASEGEITPSATRPKRATIQPNRLYM